MSDVNLNLHATSQRTPITQPKPADTPQAKEAVNTFDVETKKVSSGEVNDFMANSPATLAAMANINFISTAVPEGVKVAQAAGATVFGDEVAKIASDSLKIERYMARVDATPEHEKERIAASMAVLDNEI